MKSCAAISGVESPAASSRSSSRSRALSRVVHIAMRVSADGHEVAADRVGSEDTGHTGAQAPPRVGAMVFQAMLAFEQPDERLDAVAHVAQEGPFGRVLLRRMAARG